MSEVARSTDQHTLILGHIGTLAVNPYIFPKLPYDLAKDFCRSACWRRHVVHPDLPVKNLKEFIAYAKARPGNLSYGSAGNGSAGHLAFEYLKMTAEIMLHVPYRGTGPMVNDLLSGRVPASAIGAARHSLSRQASCAALPRARSSACPSCPTDGGRARVPGLRNDAVVRDDGAVQSERCTDRQTVGGNHEGGEGAGGTQALDGDAAEAIGGTPEQFTQFIASEQVLEEGDRARRHSAELMRPVACAAPPGSSIAVYAILLVEDEQALGTWLSKALEHAGIQVDHNGLLADRALQHGDYDALKDLGLPSMDGRMVLQRLRARDQRLPTLILTAQDALDIRWPRCTRGRTISCSSPSPWRSWRRGCTLWCAVPGQRHMPAAP